MSEDLYKNYFEMSKNEGTQLASAILFDNRGIKWKREWQNKGTDYLDNNKYPYNLPQDNDAQDMSDELTDIFFQGVLSYLYPDTDDSRDVSRDTIIKEMESRYLRKGIKFTKTIRQWLQGKKKPSQDQAYKYNCYDFCIALDLDIANTFEFMVKYFQVMPFNFKNRTDAIYYYCILHNKNYETITNMREKAKTFNVTNNETINTEGIGAKISEINDDEEFLVYLEKCCYDDEHQFITARNEVLDWLRKCKQLAGVKANSKLLMAITGYNNQIGVNGGRYDAGISKSACLPLEFSRSFPDDNTLSKIENNKKISDEALRKTLILLYFYHYYKSRDNAIGKQKIDEQMIIDSRIEFCTECDKKLVICGFSPLYPRNLYDWHILWCCHSDYPIQILKNFIEEKYTYAKLEDETDE